jgi:hypothetical protein
MKAAKLARPADYFNATLSKQQLDDIKHNIAVMKGWTGSLARAQ